MRTNGDRQANAARLAFDLSMLRRVIEDGVRTPLGARARALAWLCRWRRRPERVFWRVLPTGGQRMV